MPTVRGYRFFVDALLTVQPLESSAIERLRTELSPDLTTRDLIQSASSLLASITAQAGLVTVPRHNQSAIRQVDVLLMAAVRDLIIIMDNLQESYKLVSNTQLL